MSASEIRNALVVTVGAAVALVGAFLPWLRSGARDRSSFAIFALVDRLGFAPDGVLAWSLRAWPFVPLLVVVAVVAAWWPIRSGRVRRAAGWLTLGLCVWVVATALAVGLAPDAALFRIGPGPAVAGAGAVVLAGGTLLRLRGSAASAAS